MMASSSSSRRRRKRRSGSPDDEHDAELASSPSSSPNQSKEQQGQEEVKELQQEEHDVRRGRSRSIRRRRLEEDDEDEMDEHQEEEEEKDEEEMDEHQEEEEEQDEEEMDEHQEEEEEQDEEEMDEHQEEEEEQDEDEEMDKDEEHELEEQEEGSQGDDDDDDASAFSNSNQDEDEEQHATSTRNKTKNKSTAQTKTRTKKTTNPMHKRTTNPVGKTAEAGIIQRVSVENFMCHRKYTVNLCPNVNFIHGQNGSGKSAILAAIQICLGAGARRTHRARNLTELIRKESSSGTAKISVTLRNHDGYQPDVYGSTITVERIIGSTGGGYKLLDENGKTRSHSKQDLDQMLDQLNIQVENPVAVLDQEDAKKFLTGKPSDKYNFFTKATELERMDRTYASIIDSISELETNRTRVQESLESTMATVKRLKQVVDSFTALESLQEKVGATRRLQAWAALAEIQAEADHAKSVATMARHKLQERRAELEKLTSMGTNDEEKAMKEARIQELTVECTESADRKRQLEQQLKLAEAPLKKLERDKQQVARETRHAQQRLDAATRALQQAREEVKNRQAESEQTARLSELQDCRAQLQTLSDQEKTLREQQATYLSTYQDLEPMVDEARFIVDNVGRQLWAVQRKMDQLESSADNSASIFGGKNAGRLATEVQKMKLARKWKGPVVGPIGSFVKIAPGKEHFAALAEHAMGNVLDRFIVTNDADRALFLRLRTQIGCRRECNVYSVEMHERYHVQPPPVPGIETVASCLTIENDLVFNTLVDQARIERTALGQSKDETERLLLQRDASGRQSIRGGELKEVYFLPRGDVWKINSAGSLSMRSNERQMRSIIGADTSAAVEAARLELVQLGEEQKEHKKNESKYAQDLHQAKQQWNTVKKEQRKIKDAIDTLQDRIATLQSEIDASTDVEETDTTDLEADVANAEQDIVVLNEKMESMDKEREGLLVAIDEAKQKVEEVSARNQRVMSEMDEAERDLTAFMSKAGEREAKKEKAMQRCERIFHKLPELDEQLDSRMADAQLALRQARLLQYRYNYAEQRKSQADEGMTQDLTPEDPDDEALESIEIQIPPKETGYYAAKVEKIKQNIERERQRRAIDNISPEEAFEQYQRANNDLRSKYSQLETIKENVEHLVSDIKDRRRRWKMFRKHLVDCTTESFDNFLQLKGSSGDLQFDHKEKVLNLCYQKDNQDENTQTNDVKALSGGERSFVTLSLLLALGERLETPFRVMDEFDVFLDAPSRKIALETLVEIAKKMDHRQFILITPQDLSNITPDDKVKIFKLQAPKRKEVAVGGLTQQTID